MIIFMEFLERDEYSALFIFYDTEKNIFFGDFYSSSDDVPFEYDNIENYKVSQPYKENMPIDIYERFVGEYIESVALYGKLLLVCSIGRWYVFNVKSGKLLANCKLSPF